MTDVDRNDEEMRRLFRSMDLDLTPRSGFEAELRRRLVVAAAQREANRFRLSGLLRGGWALKVASAAAALLIFLSVGLWVSSERNPSAAFAGALSRISQSGTVSYTMTVECSGVPAYRYQVLMADPGHVRLSSPEGKVQIVDNNRRMMLTLGATQKKALLTRMPGETLPAGADQLAKLRSMHATAGRFIGRQRIDNRDLLAFHVDQGITQMTVWVDPGQDLPFRIESTTVSKGASTFEVMDEFRWNEPIPAAAFAMDIPPGYVLVNAEDGTDEHSLVELLRLCTRLSNGRFPDGLDRPDIAQLLIKDLTARSPSHIYEGKDGPIPDFDDLAKANYKACQPGLSFIERAKRDGVWHYCGQGVALGDGNAIVCYWGTPGAATFTAIFGDLQIRKVNPETLPAK